jgi:pimeloyl-ACP methyl ester carboxylesterase
MTDTQTRKAYKVKNRLTVSTRENYTTGSVISKDGTTIGYRQMGRGRGVVVLHGMMESAQSHTQLAASLADRFTVYLPDRRGRGMSGTYGEGYHLHKEVEDLEALLAQTGAHYVFGVSMGAAISLQAAITLPAIRKLALFDPPLVIDGLPSTGFMRRYDQEIARGDVISALVTGMLGSQMGPPIFNSMPRWLLKLLTKLMVASEAKKARPGDVTMKMLAPTLHYEMQLADEMAGKQENFKMIRARVLLLGTSNSPAYMKRALPVLEKVLPHVQRIEFSGLDHGASGNTNRGGQPERVAQELRHFFAD